MYKRLFLWYNILKNSLLRTKGAYMMNSNTQGHGTIKKLRTGAIVSTLALSVLGVSTTVSASESAINEPAYKFTKADVAKDEVKSTTEVSVTPKVITQDDINEAKKSSEQAELDVLFYDKALSSSKSVISYLEDRIENINKEIEEITNAITPEKLAEAKIDLENKEEALNSALNKLQKLSKDNTSDIEYNKALDEVDSARELTHSASLTYGELTTRASTNAIVIERWKEELKLATEQVGKYREDVKRLEVELTRTQNIAKEKSEIYERLKLVKKSQDKDEPKPLQELKDKEDAAPKLVDRPKANQNANGKVVDAVDEKTQNKTEIPTVGTKIDKTYQAPAQATNTNAEPKKQLPNVDRPKANQNANYKIVGAVDEKTQNKIEIATVSTKIDKTYQASVQATNTNAESKKQLPNTGEKSTNATVLALLTAFASIGFVYSKREKL